MAGALDHKRFIDRAKNPEFASQMAEWFGQGLVPPFAIVFPETRDGHLTDEDKWDKDIVQFGFVITNEEGFVLPHTRAAYDQANAKAGHTVTTGSSVLVSWSPVALVNGRPFPQSEDDVRGIFHREVCERPEEPPPSLQFLGLARRRVNLNAGGEVTYYFYLFEVRYAGPGPRGEPLLKDKNDRLLHEFVPVDDTLLASIAMKKVDLRALEALTGQDLSRYGYGTSELVRMSPHEAPPFMVRPPGVFLCHSSADKEFVTKLADRLERAGIPTWVDAKGLQLGTVWFKEAFAAIKYCQAFIVVCTLTSFGSDPVRREVEQAIRRQQSLRARESPTRYEIWPLILEGDPATTYVPEVLTDFHGVDMRDTDKAHREQTVGSLIQRLREIMCL